MKLCREALALARTHFPLCDLHDQEWKDLDPFHEGCERALRIRAKLIQTAVNTEIAPLLKTLREITSYQSGYSNGVMDWKALAESAWEKARKALDDYEERTCG